MSSPSIDYTSVVHAQLPERFPRPVGAKCLEYLREFLESGLRADMLTRFEQAFARELGVEHCVATSGCTAALMAVAAALELEDGDEVVVSPISDYGTVMGLIKERYIPVFADTSPGSINIDAESIRRSITPRTRAILVVHMMGVPCDMDAIMAVARDYGLAVIEDVCQGIFGQHKGRFLGNLGDAGAFSFDIEKTLSCDMGGCVVTNDGAFAERLRFHGQDRGERQVPGFGRVHSSNAYHIRMSHPTAAIALGQLERIRATVAHMDAMIRLLYDELREIPGVSPIEIPAYASTCCCWMAGFTIDRAAFRCTTEAFAAQLCAEGIPDAGLGKYYLLPEALTFLRDAAQKKAYPFSLPPASTERSYGPETCPNARRFLEGFIRWTSFSEKYGPSDCAAAARIIREVAQRNRR